MEFNAKKRPTKFNRTILDVVPSNKCTENGIESFLNDTAPKVERHFTEYTGSITLHIRDGKLASWESKAGGRYKE